jgi:hypothetical protein
VREICTLRLDVRSLSAFWKKSQMGGSRTRATVPETLRDGRRVGVVGATRARCPPGRATPDHWLAMAHRGPSASDAGA